MRSRALFGAAAIVALSVIGSACGSSGGGVSSTAYPAAAKAAVNILKDACNGATVAGDEFLDQGHVQATYVPSGTDNDTQTLVMLTWSGAAEDQVPVSQVCTKIDDVVSHSATLLAADQKKLEEVNGS